MFLPTFHQTYDVSRPSLILRRTFPGLPDTRSPWKRRQYRRTYRTVLENNTFMRDEQSFQWFDDSPQVWLITVVVMEILGIHDVMHRYHSILFTNTRSFHLHKFLEKTAILCWQYVYNHFTYATFWEKYSNTTVITLKQCQWSCQKHKATTLKLLLSIIIMIIVIKAYWISKNCCKNASGAL